MSNSEEFSFQRPDNFDEEVEALQASDLIARDFSNSRIKNGGDELTVEERVNLQAMITPEVARNYYIVKEAGRLA